MDFKDIKNIANEVICEKFDHAFIYNTASEGECEIAAVVERHGMRTAPVPFRSTAENLAKLFFGELKKRIPSLSSVKVWETLDSCAEFRA
jgi:6-pyruvoyltetrahydropterin/6-carboxytetrahydropterin synthase